MPDLEQLKQFAPPATTPTPEARAAAREALLKRTRRRRLPRRLLLAPALAVAAAAIVLALPHGESREDERPATTPTPTAPVPSRTLKPGQYLYTRSHGAYLTTVAEAPAYSAMIESEREVWMALDGTGWLKGDSGEPEWLSERDRARWIAAGRPPLTGKGADAPLGSDDQDGPAPLTAPKLPTDPDTLYAQLTRGKTPQQAFQDVYAALGERGVTTPEQRAALYEVAGRLPGVERDDAATDHDGRPGTGFALDDDHIRTELILDSETHALLGERETTLPGYWQKDYKPGTLIGWTVIDRVEVVNRIKERPE